MTNGWIDIKNTDMMLIMGGNPAENHPCGFKWAIEAKLHRNAKMIVGRSAIHADRGERRSLPADSRRHGHRLPRRPDQLRHRRTTGSRTTTSSTTPTPSFIVKEGFKLPEDGLYSGFDPQIYDKSTWNYERAELLAIVHDRPRRSGARHRRGSRQASAAEAGGQSAARMRRGRRRGSVRRRLPPQRRLRPLASASALRLPAAEAAVLALHAGDGRAHHRHSARTSS